MIEYSKINCGSQPVEVSSGTTQIKVLHSQRHARGHQTIMDFISPIFFVSKNIIKFRLYINNHSKESLTVIQKTWIFSCRYFYFWKIWYFFSIDLSYFIVLTYFIAFSSI